ncbi:NmrA/HSCARG family protein [Streptomyces sp. RFCAC02]|uniref:NmrA/HSCARG family protein n=1 Tax=Streptomyces sp. RFCAC02 TaxID=2499143 RepID=UPI001020426F|nr:NmrA/HSCARG family protein [Streptomyces sp. RFCAC02]
MADRANDVIVVFGGTGRQGGAVARELLRRGRPVRAVVRDPRSESARALAGAGADTVRGDMEDPATLDAALRGAYGVYSVQTFTGPDGTEGETRQGRAVADAAARAGVSHFLYGSVGGSDRGSGVPHFESKGRVERHIEALGLPATILRPAYFMDNFAGAGPVWRDGEPVLTMALDPSVPLQMIAARDIGVFAADAFDDPGGHLDRRIEIAGDELTGPGIAEVFAGAVGRPVRFESRPVEELRAEDEEMALMFDWFNRHGYAADLPALRAQHPELTTLADWVAGNWTAPDGA